MKTIIDFANKVRSLADGRISNIANVEESPSTHPYAVGKQLIFNGLLCKATSAISVGDTLAVGTNLALSDNVVEQIYSLNQGLTNSLNEIVDMNNVLGAKNLLPNNATNQTVNGVTFTVNDDGSITANGTASANTGFTIALDIDARGMILSGCPAGGSRSTYSLQYTNYVDESFADEGNGITIPLSTNSGLWRVVIWITAQSVVNNLVFKPMLRPASIQDDTYVPYSMTNREMTPYVQSISNPNLLDNPWFTVNQRGQNVYSSEGYIVDRWRLSYGTGATTHQATVNNDNSITIECEGTNNTYFSQRIENELLPGNVYTVSIKCRNIIGSPNFQFRYSDGTYGITHTVTEPLYTYKIQKLLKNSTGIIFNIHPGESITLEAVKIEKGSVSTLAMDTAPNYQQELAKCQRYFQRISIGTGQGFGYGVATSTTTARIVIPLSVPLRNAPTISISNADQILINGSSHTISNMEFHAYRAQNNFITVTVTTTGLTNEQVCVLRAGNTVETLEISADL